MKHKLLALPVLVSLGLAISSCQSNTTKIDLFLYDANDTFVHIMKNELYNSFDDSYTITNHNGNKSQVIQNNQILEVLNANNTDYILVNMVDRLSSSAIIQKANKTNTPVIFFNREPVYSDIIIYPNAYYVGTNPVQEGKNQGIMAETLLQDSKNLNKKIDKNGDNKLQCVFIQGEANHQDTERRTYACIDYLQNAGFELEILAMDAADWNVDKGYKAMENIYNKFGDKVEFVFSNNDDMAIGAIDYLIRHNLAPIDKETNKPMMPFPIVGVDGTRAGLDSIENGYLYGTTINDASKQAKAIKMLIEMLQGKISKAEFEKEFDYGGKTNYIYVSGDLVSQDNKTNIFKK